MTVIWVVEQPSNLFQNSLTMALVSEFAVRLIPSYNNLKVLLKTECERLPDGVVLNSSILPNCSKKIDAYLNCYLSNVCRIYLELIEIDQGHSADSNTESPELDIKTDHCTQFIRMNQKDIAQLRSIVSAAMMQKKIPSQQSYISYKDLSFDAINSVVTFTSNNESLTLSRKESKLLRVFLERPEQCLTRDQIKTMVWGDLNTSQRNIDSQISRLRKKLNSSSVDLKSVYGGGYELS